jgi:hypothetical protein
MRRKRREFSIFNMSALDLFASALGAFILLTVVVLPYYLKTSHTLRAQVRECRAELSTSQAANAQLEDDLAASQASNAQLKEELTACTEDRRQLQEQAASAREREQAAQQRLQACTDEQQRLERQLQACSEAREQAATELEACGNNVSECREQLNRTFLVVVMQWQTVKHDIDLHVKDPTGAEFYFDRTTIPGRPGELSEDTTRGPGLEVWQAADAEPGTYRIYYRFFKRHGNPDSAPIRGGIYYRDGHHRIPSVTLSRQGEKPLVATIVVGADGSVSIP